MHILVLYLIQFCKKEETMEKQEADVQLQIESIVEVQSKTKAIN